VLPLCATRSALIMFPLDSFMRGHLAQPSRRPRCGTGVQTPIGLGAPLLPVPLGHMPICNSFVPSRGLRQSDPFCHPIYFPLWLMVYLSHHKKKFDRGICRDYISVFELPSISHLLFADNKLLFLEVSQGQAQVINRVIKPSKMFHVV
jgi:hypothetical protein